MAPCICAAELAAGITSLTTCSLQLGPKMKSRHDDVRKLKENMERLQAQADRLNSKKKDIEEKADRNQLTQKKTNECENWLAEADKYLLRVEEFKAKYQKARRWPYVMCAFLSRAKLSRDMKKEAEEIAPVVDRMRVDQAFTDKDPEFMYQSNKEKDELPWVRKNVEKIMGYLQDRVVKNIGMWGFTGVGKTTIMRSLNDKAYRKGLFRHVLFVTVNKQNPEASIRQSIAEQMNIDIKNSRSEDQIVNRIANALQYKKYLLILDQVLDNIDLERCGIKSDHQKGKVVVATRSKKVCQDMALNEYFLLEKMSDDDAQKLFHQITGRVPHQVNTQCLPEQIVKECGRTPLLIKAVATRLKGVEDVQIWSECLSKLRSANGERFHEAFDDAFNVFKYIYDSLNDQWKKSCFLYGALYPEDHEISEDHMVECWTAEEFIPYDRSSNDAQLFKRARQQGTTAIDSFLSACLLEKGSRVKYVTIPPLFRRWALTTDEGVLSLVKSSDDESTNYPAAENRGQARRISLQLCNDDLGTLLEGVDLKNVSTLFLQRNVQVETIPDLVFGRRSGILLGRIMSEIRVLDLGYTGIAALQPAISNLVRLKALYVNDCDKLVSVPAEIRQLKDLEVLDIRRTGVPSWPSEIGDLISLKCLRVSFKNHAGSGSSHTAAPSRNVIGRLSSLEELTVHVDNGNANVEWLAVVGHIIKELVGLQVLTTLCFYFPTVKCLSTFIGNSASWKRARLGRNTFRAFKIHVGSSRKHRAIDMSDHNANHYLKYFADDNEVGEAISDVLKQTCTFELIGHKTIENLSSFGTDSIQGLKVCAIEDCCQMTSVIGQNCSGVSLLEELKQLHLTNLANLTCMFDCSTGDESFVNLTTLTIKNCNKLEIILPFEVARRIPLEYLKVENCSKVVAIIGAATENEGTPGTGENPNGVTSKLKSLELAYLPELESYLQNAPVRLPFLRPPQIVGCPKLPEQFSFS